MGKAGQRFAESLTFSSLSLSFPATSPAFPLAFSRLLPVALPACFLVLPLMIFPLALVLLPRPIAAPLSCGGDVARRALPDAPHARTGAARRNAAARSQLPRRVHLKHFWMSAGQFPGLSAGGASTKDSGLKDPGDLFRLGCRLGAFGRAEEPGQMKEDLM